MIDPLTFVALVTQYIREPSGWSGPGQPVFTPPLTVAEQATLDDLRQMAKLGVNLSLEEWQAIKSDVAALKAYNNVASPTLAQTANVSKAQNRIIAALLRA